MFIILHYKISLIINFAAWYFEIIIRSTERISANDDWLLCHWSCCNHSAQIMKICYYIHQVNLSKHNIRTPSALFRSKDHRNCYANPDEHTIPNEIAVMSNQQPATLDQHNKVHNERYNILYALSYFFCI